MVNDENLKIGDTDSKIECKVCNKVFRSKKLLSGHNSKIHTPKPFSCEDCPKSFVDWLNLRRHAFQYHPASAKNLTNLLTKKKSENTPKSDSDVEMVKSDDAEKIEMNKVLEEEDDLLMEEPDIQITNQDSGESSTVSFQSILANAMVQKNDNKDGEIDDDNGTGEIFECTICDKVFGTAPRLKRHKVIHTGDKPYSCDLCESSFNQKANLK